jgi:hypothetical protein
MSPDTVYVHYVIGLAAARLDRTSVLKAPEDPKLAAAFRLGVGDAARPFPRERAEVVREVAAVSSLH